MKINELNRKYKTAAELLGIEYKFKTLYQQIIEYRQNRKLFPAAPNLTPLLVKGFNDIANRFINWLPDDPKLNKDKALVKKLKYKLSILK